jgi:hypothetical protein
MTCNRPQEIVLELSDREKAIVMELNNLSIRGPAPIAESTPGRLSP